MYYSGNQHPEPENLHVTKSHESTKLARNLGPVEEGLGDPAIDAKRRGADGFFKVT